MALKLKQFDSSIQSSRVKQSTISVSPAGKITFSSLALEETGFKIGDKVSLFQDEDEPTDWFFGKSETGIALSETKGEGFFQAKAIAQSFLESLDLNSSARFKIGPTDHKMEKQKIWSVFTRKPITLRKKKEA